MNQSLLVADDKWHASCPFTSHLLQYDTLTIFEQGIISCSNSRLLNTADELDAKSTLSPISNAITLVLVSKLVLDFSHLVSWSIGSAAITGRKSANVKPRRDVIAAAARLCKFALLSAGHKLWLCTLLSGDKVYCCSRTRCSTVINRFISIAHTSAVIIRIYSKGYINVSEC